MLTISEGFELKQGNWVKEFVYVFDSHTALCRDYELDENGNTLNNTSPCPVMTTSTEIARLLELPFNEVEFITK